MQFQSLPGFREFYPEACSKRDHIFGLWRQVSHNFCFQEYDAPVLEPLELYIEKSGEEIVGQLFNFTDKGGRAVSLRPEMTPSLARLIGAKANSLKRPVKWFNIGAHYRYERQQKGRLRSFYQYNADIFGEAGPGAEAELITLLAQTFTVFGLKSGDFKIRLSDRDLWFLVLEAEGLDETQCSNVLGVIDKMERTERSKTVERLSAILFEKAEAFLCRIEQLVSIRDFSSLETYILDLVPEGAHFDQAKSRLAIWSQLIDSLESSDVLQYVEIDMGIVRGLAYYTGFVFEAFEVSGQSRALAGGGRYNTLVQKLGGPAIPAVGFAMGDVTLTDLLESKGLVEDTYLKTPDIILIIGGPEERKIALADATILRNAGFCLEYPLKDQSFGKQFKDANQKGARFALIYGAEEVAKNIVKVRDLKNGEESEIVSGDLLEVMRDLL